MAADKRQILRICCIGDSLTQGYSRRGRHWHPYPALLSRNLTSDLVVVETHNHGISGETTEQIRKRVMATCFSPSYPTQRWEAAVILAGTNDLGYQLPIESAVENIRAIGRVAKAKGAMVFVMTIPPVAEMISNETIDRLQTEMNKLLRVVCEGEAFNLIDLFSVMCEEGKTTLKPQFADPDGLHLSKEGYENVALLVAKYLTQSIILDG